MEQNNLIDRSVAKIRRVYANLETGNLLPREAVSATSEILSHVIVEYYRQTSTGSMGAGAAEAIMDRLLAGLPSDRLAEINACVQEESFSYCHLSGPIADLEKLKQYHAEIHDPAIQAIRLYLARRVAEV